MPKHSTHKGIRGTGGYINYTSTVDEGFLGYAKYTPRLESRQRGYFLHVYINIKYVIPYLVSCHLWKAERTVESSPA